MQTEMFRNISHSDMFELRWLRAVHHFCAEELIMRTNNFSKSAVSNLRSIASVLLVCGAASLTLIGFAQAPASGPSPASGTLSASNRSITYNDSTGSLPNPSAVALGAPDCTAPDSCSVFTLTIDPSVGQAASGYDPAQFEIVITENWNLSTNDYDTFVEDSKGNVVAQNTSTADPEIIHLQTTIAPGVYQIILVMATGAPVPYTGTVTLQAKPATTALCDPSRADCTPPRYQSYPAGAGQADNAGEPSLGVDFNPNVATLKHDQVNTGGVAFFTSGSNEWRVNFDDCSSPAIYKWEDVSAPFTQTFVLSDPIGFVDHYSSAELGLKYPEPPTPGRVFTLDLIGGEGNSLGSYSDDDGGSYLPGGNGGPGQGPDHETLGGGPYSANQPVPIQHPNYPNAIYYCSQNIVAEAQCSRSDNGGQTFGPGVPIYSPAQCTGGIHGHVKVAPDGTVYVPNSSCGTVGTTGVAVSTDNGLTWTENNVPGSSSTQDPSVGIGQNHVGKPAGNLTGTNTVYIGYVDGDGHPKVSHSGDRGANWSAPVDVGTPFGITHAVFPVVVAGDDNRASFAFLGTGDGITAPGTSGTCDPFGATLNCANIWHLYIATTYDGGKDWITVDATPDDPVQTGTVCLQGTTCSGGRNLLDFNDFAIDAEGRGLVGYADGCVNCSNTFKGQSAASHGTVTRQSGGRRLFAAFDPKEPSVPAAPQMVSAISQPGGALVTWLEPDNGGSPITGYKVYRGASSGGETLLATVSGETTLKYLDPAPPAGNVYYYVDAVNAVGESTHCREVALAIGPPVQNICVSPGVTELTDPAGDTSAALGLVNTPAPPGSDLLALQVSQPYQLDGVLRLVFTISTDPGESPQPSGSAWYVAMKIGGKYKGVHMAWYPTSPTTPVFESYTPAANNSGGVDGRFVTPGTTKPAESTSSYSAPYNKVVIVVKASDLGLNPGDTIDGFVSGVSQSTDPGNMVGIGATALYDMMPDSLAFTGSLTVKANLACAPNAPPVAVLTATPQEGAAPLNVNFSGASSSDPDAGDSVASYTFDFGDGSAPVTQSSPTIAHTYSTPGNYPARLTVTDTHGAVSTNAAQVIIGVDSILQNISTRAQVLTGDNVMIGGFIISGNQPKKVIVRAIGPSLKSNGQPLPGAMQDPTLELHDANSIIATNDNWKVDDKTGQSQQKTVEDTGLAPSDDRESALVMTLAPGTYTGILRGKDGSTGIALVEAYDLDTPSANKFANISTRGLVQSGDNVMIGGFVAGPGGAAASDVLIRGLGPSLANQGVPNTLQDPTLELRDGNGAKIASNDNWRDTQQSEIQATGIPPSDDRESAIYADDLMPGAYTAVLAGKGGTTGIGLVEVYNLP
jgi:PKD repeat protein